MILDKFAVSRDHGKETLLKKSFAASQTILSRERSPEKLIIVVLWTPWLEERKVGESEMDCRGTLSIL